MRFTYLAAEWATLLKHPCITTAVLIPSYPTEKTPTFEDPVGRAPASRDVAKQT